jgi:hypothetical protein
MLVRPIIALAIAALEIAISSPARADPRDVLRVCQAMVNRAAQPARDGATKPDDAELARCRQVIRDWTLRDSRMTVDEDGRPLR